jgi:hypothetical protein
MKNKKWFSQFPFKIKVIGNKEISKGASYKVKMKTVQDISSMDL